MNDHETYLLLAAKQVGEGLTPSEEAELDAHLATCPSCRSFTAGMRRDDILLRGQLGEVAVAPRVRQRVLDEAYGQRRRFDPRIVLALAATLLLGTIGATAVRRWSGARDAVAAGRRRSDAIGDAGNVASPSPTPLPITDSDSAVTAAGCRVLRQCCVRLQRAGTASRFRRGTLRGRGAGRRVDAEPAADGSQELVRRTGDLPRHRGTRCVARWTRDHRHGRRYPGGVHPPSRWRRRW